MTKLKQVGLIAILLILLCTTAVCAEGLADRLAVGFQITQQFSGFSVKYELSPGQIIQPIFYLSASGAHAGAKTMEGTLALRLLYDLGIKGSYRQYLGWGVGLKTVKETENDVRLRDDTNYGFQGFVGLETARPGAAVSTSVELSLGIAEDGDSSGGGYKAGFGLALGLHYHF